MHANFEEERKKLTKTMGKPAFVQGAYVHDAPSLLLIK